MWRILSRYIFREILSSALLGTGLATGVIFLQGVGAIFDVVVRSTTTPKMVLYLFTLALPPLLPLTIPFGTLVGILIGLGRMAADGEITAMRASGVSSRKVILPVLFFAFLMTAIAGACSLRLTPLAYRESQRLENELAATQLSVEIQPHVFDEDFPNTILYVGDVRPGPVALWRNVFIADVTPPEQRTSGMRQKAEGPMITVAHESIAVPDIAHNRIQLSLRDGSTHEMGKDGVANNATFPRGEQALQASSPTEVHKRPFKEMNTRQLIPLTRGPDWVEARIELQQRLALPLACMVLAMVGIPLGISTRKGGKSGGYVTAVVLAFFCYYLAFISLIGLAKQRTLPVAVAVWLPNMVFFVAGLIFLIRLETPGDRDLVGSLRSVMERIARAIESRFLTAPKVKKKGPSFVRMPLLPQIVDTYVVWTFLFYVVLWLISLVSLTEIYNFFELLGDIVRNKIPLWKVFTYLFFLTPTLIYDMLPITILVAVLVTFGVMSKHNEVTAFKACGVSLYRLALPILLGAGFLSAGLFAFDHYYVPEANRRQDALRNEIKGRAPQSYLRPDRKWILAKGSRIYYYKYFDQVQHTMAGVSVFELQPETFRLLRWISAERAHWEPGLQTWVFENGWNQDFTSPRTAGYHKFQVDTFSELNEPPSYFLKEVLQDKQMNFQQLEDYIRDLRQSGFDTVKLQVRFYRKFSVPLFALIMALIAVPFSFLVGNRGAMAGIGVSLGIAILYLGIGTLFEKIGDVSQLPPVLAAWSPDALFSLMGLYLLLRMRS